MSAIHFSHHMAGLLAATAFLFVAQQLPFLTVLHLGLINTPFYLVFLVLGIMSFWDIFNRSQGNTETFIRHTLRLFLPMQSIIIVGLFLSTNFHLIIFLGAGAYILIAFAYWAFITVRKEQSVSEKTDHHSFLLSRWLHEQGRQNLALVVLITILFFSFGFSHLSRFAAVDEPLWLEDRIPKFWKNLHEGDLHKTNVSDKPGITTAYTTGAGLLFFNPKDYDDTRFVYDAKHPGADIEDVYFAFRLPQLIMITLFLPFSYFLLTSLISKRAALFSYAFIALSPILVGMSKIINPDSLLWLFVPLSFIAYLAFQEKRQFRLLFLSALFLGFALLTKYVANFLFVYFFGFIFLSYLYTRASSPLSFAEHFRRELTNFCLWLGTGLSVFYLLLPAVWQEPSELFTSTIMSEAFERVAPLFVGLVILVLADRQWLGSRIMTTIMDGLRRIEQSLGVAVFSLFLLSALAALANGMLHMSWFDFPLSLSSPKSIYLTEGAVDIFLANFYPFIFGLPIITLISLFLAVGLALRKGALKTPTGFVTLAIVLFILLYYIGSTVNQVVLISRYQIVLYPLAGILAGIGMSAFVTWLGTTLPPFAKIDVLYPITISVVICILVFTLIKTPFPMSYASALLPTNYTIDIKDMGAGSYEAAQYLNQLPDAKSLAIWTDKRGVCKFFVGQCTDGFDFSEIPSAELDYVVISSGRESRTERMLASPYKQNDIGFISFDDYYSRTDAIWSLFINGRLGQSVKIFRFEP